MEENVDAKCQSQVALKNRVARAPGPAYAVLPE
jgi:hypothetical protein